LTDYQGLLGQLVHAFFHDPATHTVMGRLI